MAPLGVQAMPDPPESHFERIRTPTPKDADLRSPAPSPDRGDLAILYSRAIRRYVGSLLRDDHDADEVAQEVLVKFLRGDFDRSRNGQGRFRDYLKVAARNTALNYLRGKRRRASTPLGQAAENLQDPANWDEHWRQILLDRAWNRVRDYERSHRGNLYATLLEWLRDQPELNSAQVAAVISERSGKRLSPAALRQQVHRARHLFADAILAEIRLTLEQPDPATIHDELRELGLLPHVQPFLPEFLRAPPAQSVESPPSKTR